MKTKRAVNFLKDNVFIILIMVMSAFLNTFGIWKLGYANLYYSSAVYSMGKSFHAFLYNSIDTLGYISIDKPPLGLWIQTVFTKIFGFSGVTVLLPQAICGVISVAFLYHIIKSRFGKLPGLISAAVLAFTPIFVAVCRNNTIDSLLILTLLIATEFAIKAAEQSRPKYLFISALLIGVGFNIKMLQAYIIVPAVFLTYLILSKQKIAKRILSCVLAFLIMAVVSLSWVTFVDLTPASQRPWVGSSDSNSEIDLALGYNGIKRIIGGVFGKMGGGNDGNKNGTPPQMSGDTDDGRDGFRRDFENGEQQGTSPEMPNNQNGASNTQAKGNPPEMPNNQQNDTSNTQAQGNPPAMPNNQNGNSTENGQNGSAPKMPQDGNDGKFDRGDMNVNKQGGGMGGPSGEAGNTSLVRLFTTNNAGQISWFLLPAAAFAVLGVILAIKKRKELREKNPAIIYFVSAFLPMFIYYSFASGLAHRYYFASFAPFIAGLVGIGVYLLRKDDKVSKLISMLLFAATAAAELFIQFEYQWLPILFYIMLAVLALATAAFIFMKLKGKGKKLIPLTLVPLFILPIIWSATPIMYGDVTQIPISGPELQNNRQSIFGNGDFSSLISYLEKNRDGAKYLVATPSSMDAGSSIILQSGEPVMCLGGFNGQDSPLTATEFETLCKNGTVKYVLLTERTNNSEVLTWVEKNGTQISNSECGLTNSNYKLYKVS